MRKLILSIAAASSMLSAAAEVIAPRLLDDAVMKELSGKGTITRVFQDTEAPALLPAVDSADELAAEIEAFEISVGVEVLRLMPAARTSMGKPLDLPVILNTLASASAMKGMTYWSVTRKARRVLFLESYAVESPERLSRIPDPVFSSVPAETRMYTFQEDATFGRNVYLSTFFGAGNHLRVKTENTNAITYFFIPVIPQGGLVNHSIVIPTENGVLFYGVALLRSSLPVGDMKARAESLTNRVIAAADWLETRLRR
jgi:hypothetical protein